MVGSAVVYTGLAILLAGLIGCARPIGRLGVPTRARAVIIAVGGAALVVMRWQS